MEENNQDLNNVPVTAEEVVPTVPETPVVPEAAPAEPMVAEAPVAETPAMSDVVPAEPVMEPAPVMPEAPVVETPAMPEATAEVAPAMPEAVPAEPVMEPAPVMPESPVVETPAMPEATAEVAPAMPEAPVAPTMEQTEVSTLPVVDPVPAVTEMPEAPVPEATLDAPVDNPAMPEAVPTEPTMEAAPTGDAPASGEKKSKAGLIIIIALLLVAIGAAVYFFLIKGKEDKPTPEPANNTVVERAAKYFKDANGNGDITLYEDDNTFVLNYNSLVLTGTYTNEETNYSFSVSKEYVDSGCSQTTGRILTLTINEDGSITGNDDVIGGVQFSTATKGDVKAFTETDCISPADIQPDENTTTGENKTEENETKTVEVTKISLSDTKKTLTVGKDFTLKATVTPKDATDKTVTWTTSDEKIATVKDGKVTAVAKGTATITATTVNGKKAECKVTVEEEKVAEEPKEEANAYPNCTYKDTVREEGSGQYTKFKQNDLNEAGENAGTKAAQACKPLSEIIEAVKKAVREEAEKCWTADQVTKAVESAECKLTPGCDKTAKYGEEAKFNEKKKNSIVDIWNNPVWNCSGLEYSL